MDLVVVLVYTSVQPYKSTVHAVAKRTAVTSLPVLARTIVVLDIDNPLKERWQRHFHVSMTRKNVETKKMSLSARESILEWKQIQVNELMHSGGNAGRVSTYHTGANRARRTGQIDH